MNRLILKRLARGPATNRQLQQATGNYWSGGISRTMAEFIKTGRAKRIDGNSGRGTIAVYALAETFSKEGGL